MVSLTSMGTLYIVNGIYDHVDDKVSECVCVCVGLCVCVPARTCLGVPAHAHLGARMCVQLG